MKITITEYDSQGKIMQKLEYCSYQETEFHYSNMLTKEIENEKEKSRTQKQKTKQGTI